jgi:hypothetical protein
MRARLATTSATIGARASGREAPGPARRRPPQLVVDDALHAAHLVAQHLRVGPVGGELGAQHGQRRLEAVGEVVHRRAVAVHALALAGEQRVEAAGDAVEFHRIAAAEGLAPARLHRADLGGEAAERHEPALERHRERRDQHQHHRGEPAQQLAPEGADLGAVGGQVDGREHLEGGQHRRAQLPADADAEHLGLRPVGQAAPEGRALAGLERRPGTELDADGGRRPPQRQAVAVEDLRVEAGAGVPQPRLQQPARHREVAGLVGLGGPDQRVDLGGELLDDGIRDALAEDVLEQRRGPGEGRQQDQRRRDQQAPDQRPAGRHGRQASAAGGAGRGTR